METSRHSGCHLKLASAPDSAIAEKVFDLVWRFDFASPGFCLLDAGFVDTHVLRFWMAALKSRLGEISVHRGGRPFLFASMARFDQQVTTKFHLDGAPPESMLILGYEPSSVVSRLFLADFTHAAFDLGITPRQFLSDFNPMYKRGEELLGRYVTELPQPAEGHSRILAHQQQFAAVQRGPNESAGGHAQGHHRDARRGRAANREFDNAGNGRQRDRR